jgi:hypothetical protein
MGINHVEWAQGRVEWDSVVAGVNGWDVDRLDRLRDSIRKWRSEMKK